MLPHRTRSEDFYRAMKFLAAGVDTYGNAVALLAVHCAISLTDAIMIGCTGKRCNEEDHRAAVRALSRLCGERRLDADGIKHFSWLIERKTQFAYGDRRLDPDKDVKSAVLRADRFTAWAYRIFPEIAKAGQEQ